MNLTAFQEKIVEIPPEINLALLGGRAGGKSTAAILLALKEERQRGHFARMMAVRRSYPAFRDFEQSTRDVFSATHPNDARYSANDHVWKFSSGAFLELSQLDSHDDLLKAHGRSITWLFIDELQQYASPELPDRLRANLRAPRGIPIRMVVAANPGDVGQIWIWKRWIAGRTPWKAFKDEHGAWWMWCPSTIDDNDKLDQESVRRQIRSSTPDPELVKALLEGSFTSATGSYFGMVLDETRNAVGPFKSGKLPETNGVPWRHWISVDHGSKRPAVAYLLVESPGATYEGKFYPRGSIIALDEYAEYREDNLNEAFNSTIQQIAEGIVEMCKLWDAPPSGYMDDASFAANTGHTTSYAQEYGRFGVRLTPARKGSRVAGWEVLRRLMAAAGDPDQPGLYISRACVYAWLTLPFLSRSKKNPEDVDSNTFDHGADALRYGVLRGEPPITLKMGVAHR